MWNFTTETFLKLMTFETILKKILYVEKIGYYSCGLKKSTNLFQMKKVVGYPLNFQFLFKTLKKLLLSCPIIRNSVKQRKCLRVTITLVFDG